MAPWARGLWPPGAANTARRFSRAPWPVRADPASERPPLKPPRGRPCPWRPRRKPPEAPPERTSARRAHPLGRNFPRPPPSLRRSVSHPQPATGEQARQSAAHPGAARAAGRGRGQAAGRGPAVLERAAGGGALSGLRLRPGLTTGPETTARSRHCTSGAALGPQRCRTGRWGRRAHPCVPGLGGAVGAQVDAPHAPLYPRARPAQPFPTLFPLLFLEKKIACLHVPVCGGNLARCRTCHQPTSQTVTTPQLVHGF